MTTKKALTIVNASSITASADSAAVALPDNYTRWVITTSLGTVSGTTPTLDITIQHSVDATNWITLTAVAQRTAAHASTLLHTFAASATDYLKPLLPYVRASYTIGGTATPTFNNVNVKIIVE